jgi:hypothetical protein
MAYSPDPTNPLQPTTAQLAGNMAFELQALKGYIQSLIAGGTNFSYIGGFRNRLKNGSFNIAQRSTAITALAGVPAYTLDQWLVSSTTGNTVVNRTNASPPVSNNNYMVLTGAAGVTLLDVVNRIEALDCQDMVAGTPVTISGFYLAANILSGLPLISILTPTASDNWSVFSSFTQVAMTLVTGPQVAGTWQYFSNTFILPSDCTKGMGVLFEWTGAQIASKQVSLANIQLEKGSQHTPFEFRPAEVELAVCQRYYQTFLSLSASVATAGAQTLQYLLTLPVTMRAAPTVARAGVTLTNATLPGAPVATTGAVADAYSSVAAGVASVNYTVTLSSEL